jgi:hypothetical protein
MPGKMYLDDLAARYKGGEPYCPSNGTEGEMFFDVWCNQCKADKKFRQTLDGEDGCPIISASMRFDIKDEFYPKEWIHDGKGQPCCTAFDALRTTKQGSKSDE